RPLSAAAGPLPATIERDGLVVVRDGAGKDPKDAALTVDLRPGAGALAAVKLELVPHANAGGASVRGRDTTTVRLQARLVRAGGAEQALEFRFADAAAKAPQYRNGHEVLGLVPAGWKTPVATNHQLQTSAWELAAPVALADGDRVVLTV